jgi:cytochrome c553
MLNTMPPRKKPSRKEPNPNAVFVRLDDETAEALAAFIKSQKVAPERPAVIVHALRAFLTSEGFLKPAK